MNFNLLVFFFQLFSLSASKFYMNCDEEDEVKWTPEGIELICRVDVESAPNFDEETFEKNAEGVILTPGNYEISNELLSEMFKSLNKMSYLKLTGLKFENLNIQTFESGGNLRDLEMNKCLIERLDDFTFKNLRNLEFLDLEDNLLSTLSPNVFYGLNSLIDLHLNLNKLSAWNGDEFQHIGSLTKLVLAGNHIEALNESIFMPLKNLEILQLDSNRFSTIPSNLIKHNRNLSELHLGDNRISSFKQDIIECFKRIKYLDLTNNVCVDQLFEYFVSPNEPERILNFILFPFCQNFVKHHPKSYLDDPQDNSTIILILLSIFSALALAICCCGFCFVRTRRRKNLVRSYSIEEQEKNFNELIFEYSDKSSVHGVKYLGERGRHWIER